MNLIQKFNFSPAENIRLQPRGRQQPEIQSVSVIRCQFHQHITCAFFVQKCFAQLFFRLWQKDFSRKAPSYEKRARYMLMKFTIGLGKNK